MSYRELEIWKLSRGLVIEIHRMTLRDLPKFEQYEEGSQIRRSMKSVKSNIVEGYGRRRYKQDFIRFLTYAHASCDETIDHLENLFDTGSLTTEKQYLGVHQRLDTLGRQINCFIDAVTRQHLSAKESTSEYLIAEYASPDPASRIPDPSSHD